jgi:hypothetical protein
MERAIPMSGQPVKRGTMAHDHDLFIMLTSMASRLSDVEVLRAYAPRAEALATRDGHTLYAAMARRALGVLHRLDGDFAGAERELNEALNAFRAFGTRWQAGWTLSELGELAVAQDDPAAARAHYAEALAHFEAMQAAPDASRARAALETL